MVNKIYLYYNTNCSQTNIHLFLIHTFPVMINITIFVHEIDAYNDINKRKCKRKCQTHEMFGLLSHIFNKIDKSTG